MSAAYQAVPTLAQQRELDRWVQRNYPARQYRDTQAIADFQAARIRYSQPEPAQFCAVPTPGEDGDPQVWEWVGSTPVLIIVALACVAWVAYFWSHA